MNAPTSPAPSLVLATDLDGTFLGGSDEQRADLYASLSAREDAMLVFVTGRDIDFIAELIQTPGMPRPHYIIGDIGTSVFDGVSLRPWEDFEAPIKHAWGDSGAQVRAMLAQEPGLAIQNTPFRYRVSYDYDPALLTPASVAKVEAAGFDCIVSAGRFFDVLPKGVNKGTTPRAAGADAGPRPRLRARRRRHDERPRHAGVRLQRRGGGQFRGAAGARHRRPAHRLPLAPSPARPASPTRCAISS